MDKPTITTIYDTYIAYNGEAFRVGDIVHYVMECGGRHEEATGRFIEMSDIMGGILKFECSKEYESIINRFNICNLKSIRHVELKGTEE